MKNINELQKEELKQAVNSFNSISKITRHFGFRCSKKISDDFRNILEENNIDYSHLKGETKIKLLKMDINDLRDLVKRSSSFTDLFASVGTKRCSDFTRRFRNILEENNIDYSHFFDNKKKEFSKGQVFGRWKVLERGKKKSSWLCECECGTKKEVLQTHLIQRSSNGCIKCSRLRERSSQFTGIGDLSGNRLYILKKQAEQRNLQFSVSKEYLWEIYLKQDKKCKLSGIDIYFGIGNQYGTASLDRIDNNKGYVEGNVQWLHKDINKMKNIHDQNYFIELCWKIVNETTKLRKETA